MNRTEMVEAIALDTGVSPMVVAEVVGSFLDLMVSCVALGEVVSVRGFGRFEPRMRGATLLRKALDGSPVDVPPRRTVVFLPSAGVKARLNP